MIDNTTKRKKLIPIILSLFLSLAALGVLLYIIFIYKSHPVYKVADFPSKLQIEGDLLEGDGCAYKYNEYGGSFSKSNSFYFPVSQYDGPEADFLYYKFDSKYYAAIAENSMFSGLNTQSRFLFRDSGRLYVVNTDEKTCVEIACEHNIHSASLGGTYFLEIEGNEYRFYKIGDDFELSSPVLMQFSASDTIEFCFWINDRYVVTKTNNEEKLLYLITDASNGETVICAGIDNTLSNQQKELFSKKFIIESIDENSFTLFNIYTQEKVEFKCKEAKDYKILEISENASYIVAMSDSKPFIISKKGKKTAFSEFLSGEYLNSFFIMDNILTINYSKDTATASSAFKILF